MHPVKIKIVKLPLYTTFGVNDRIMFYGLLCKVINSDGSYTFLEKPHLEYPEPDIPGTYKLDIYLDAEHSYGLKKTIKFRMVDEVVDCSGEGYNQCVTTLE